MNSIYRSIWNDKTGTFVAVSENAKSAGKKTSSGSSVTGTSAHLGLKTLALSLMVGFGANVYAAPAGGVVVQGGASISNNAGNTTINQSTQNAAINWQSFNIGAGETVQFVQPNSKSVALNRVLGSDPSSILGNLSANGRVILVNPNGVLFAKGAQVNVGGLVASTLNISDSDFMAGNYQFAGTSDKAVLNQGTINADGGHVALLGANVSNDGVISARLGTVALAAGNAITLDVAGDGLLNVTVNQGAVDALVQNGGLIQADGGQVLLTAQSAGSLLPSAVNNTGVIRAQTLVTGEDGSIKLMGDMQNGTVNVGGTLDASAPNGGDGGFVETSAAHVKVADNAIVTTQSAQGKSGTWLIDPTDFNIGGANSDILGTTLEAQLVTNSIVIDTATGINATNPGATPPVTGYTTSTTGADAGNINVNEDVSWKPSSGVPTTLTLNAAHDVNFNANITATGGNLVANAGNDIIVKAGLSTGITATFAAVPSGNITWTAGRDVTVNSQVTATGGDFTVCCGRDIKVNAAVTTTDGDVLLKAGRDIVVAAAMTTTRGDVLLRAGSEPSLAMPGLIGGTVVFTTDIPYTINGQGANTITVDYTPTSYNSPKDYSGNFTGATLTQHMLVFAKGNDKVYDGNRDATLSFRGDPTLGGNVTLVPDTTATALFDTKDVGTDKPIKITYNGYSLGGTNASKFVLWNACGVVAGTGTTFADITAVPLLIKANPDSKTYDGAPYINGNGVVYGAFVGGEGPDVLTGVLDYDGTSQGAVTPGTYAINPLGLTSSNYVITYAPNTLLIRPKLLIGGITAADKLYDANTSATITGHTLDGVVGTDVVSYTGDSATFDTPDVGTGKTVTGTDLSLSGDDADNYTVNSEATTTATINDSTTDGTGDTGSTGDTGGNGGTPPDDTPPVEAPPEVATPVPPTTWVPTVVPAELPPELQDLVPPVVPVVAPPPPVVPVQAPPEVYVAPHRPPKQDRN